MSRPNEGVGIIVGILLIVVMHCLVLAGLILVSSYLPFFKRDYNVFLIPISVGLWQTVYVIPLIIFLKKRQAWGVMKGVIACGVLTALLNGGCWIFFISK